MQPVESREDAVSGRTDRLDLDWGQLQRMLQQIPVGILIARPPSGAVCFASRYARRLLGCSTEEIAERLEQHTRAPEGRSYAPGEFPLTRSITRGEVVTDEEVGYERSDGQRLTLRISAAPLTGPAGEVTAGVLILTDVTDRKRFQAVARRSQDELLDFFENAAEGLHWAGPDGTLLWANQAELDLLGYTPEEYIGHPIAEFHADPAVADEILTRLKRNETLRDFEADLRCKDGSIKHVLINANVLWFEGQFLHTRCFTRDITERKQLERQLKRRVEELAEADRRKDLFLAMLGHELRNPLAAVNAAVALMERRASDPDAVEQGRRMIARQIRQMARLTDDLLDVARITHGTIELRKERVDLAVIVARAVETVRPVLDACRQELEVSSCPSGVFLLADPARLEQILVNLLGNAARHSGSPTPIRLDLDYQDGEALLRVRDDGAGIPREMLVQIFEPFVRIPTTREGKGNGLGLGLTLVKKLVELHGGSVEARSPGPGCGCEFVVRLPAVGEARADAGPGDGRQPAKSGFGRRILLVDDNEDAAWSLGELLRLLGHEVDVVYSGPEAIERAIARRPEVVLLDIGMPGMDGYEVARRLKESGALEGALLIAMTGYGQDRDRERSRAEGFHHHLVKPIEVNAILALLGGT